MAQMINCLILKQESEKLDYPPYPGELGQRIHDNISKEGWQQWLERLTTIINENQLSTADTKSVKIIESHMVGFLFGEGDMGGLPPGYMPPGAKK